MRAIWAIASTAVVALAIMIAGTQISFAGIVISGPDGEPIKQPPLKHALVIGVADYENLSKLENTINDAELVGTALEELGFDVVRVMDPSLKLLRAQIEDYADQLNTGAVSAVYYSGHGAEASGATYLVARDANVRDADDLKQQGITLAAMMNLIGQTGAAAHFYFIDTSRSNPFTGENGTSKLVPDDDDLTTVSGGSVVVYSTSPGAEAMDGEGDNGPFAAALANQLGSSGLELNDLMREVRSEVLKATDGKQVPQDTSALLADFYFNASQISEVPEEPSETRAAKVLYRKADGKLASTYADGSYALLIGVGDYAETKSGTQAWNDLKHVEDELTRLGGVLEDIHGFEVEKVFDPTGDELEAALENFVNLHGPKPNARLMIMMSGHGTTTEKYGRKTAWFVPSDAPATEPPAPFLNTALNLRRVEEWSEIMAAKHVMWVFDSCFSGAAIRMIESKSGDKLDGWAEHLHQNPVRRVLTAGSENEKVPAKSRFTETMIRVLSGQTAVDGAGDYITGQQLGAHLKQDIIRFNFKQGLPKNTPQSDTIVIPGEEGDVVFSIDPELSKRWLASAD